MSIKKILDTQIEMKVDIAEIKGTQKAMKTDLAHHIKRTDILEKKTHKLLYAALIGVGYLAAKYGFGWISFLL